MKNPKTSAMLLPDENCITKLIFMKTTKEKFSELKELNDRIANWMYDCDTPYEKQHYRRIQQQCKKIINESKN